MATECSTVEGEEGISFPLLLVTLPSDVKRVKGLVALKTRMSREGEGDYCCHETDRESYFDSLETEFDNTTGTGWIIDVEHHHLLRNNLFPGTFHQTEGESAHGDGTVRSN